MLPVNNQQPCSSMITTSNNSCSAIGGDDDGTIDQPLDGWELIVGRLALQKCSRHVLLETGRFQYQTTPPPRPPCEESPVSLQTRSGCRWRAGRGGDLVLKPT